THNPHSLASQKGDMLRSMDFINKLKTLQPNVLLRPVPGVPHKAYYGAEVGGQFTLISGGEYPIMPEWSIIQDFYENVPTISPLRIKDKEGIELEHFTPEIAPFTKIKTAYQEKV